MIYLYPPGTKDISKGGHLIYGARNDILFESLNGRYDLRFDISVEDYKKQMPDIKEFSIIGCRTPRREKEKFYVTNITKGERFVTVEAKHIFFTLGFHKVSQIWNYGRPQSILDRFQATCTAREFTFSSDISRMVTVIHEHGGNALTILADGEESILGKSRGELERINESVAIKQRIGKASNYLLAKRKNINDFSLVKDAEGLVTRLNIKKAIDPATFIPKPNGQGKVNPNNPYPETGQMGHVYIRLYDGGNNALIDHSEGRFDIYDMNGYKVAGGMETGSKRSIVTWNERKKTYQDRIASETQRLADLAQRKTELEQRLADQREKLQEAQSAVAGAKNPETAQRRVKSAQNSIENTIKQQANNDEYTRKAQANLKENQDLLAKVPTVILGGRRILNLLTPGEYIMVQTKAPDDYIATVKPKKFTIVHGQDTYIDWYNNHKDRPEDQTEWLYATVNSPLINEYPYVFEKDIELRDEEFKTKEDLIRYGDEYFTSERPDLPMETLTFTATSEVVNSGLGLGDSAVILYEDYGLYKDLPLVEYEFSPIQNRYRKVTFGEVGINLKASIVGEFKGGLRDLEAYLQSDIDSKTTAMLWAFSSEYSKLREDFVGEMNDQRREIEFRANSQMLQITDQIQDMIQENVSVINTSIDATTKYADDLDTQIGTVQSNLNTIESEIKGTVGTITSDLQEVKTNLTAIDGKYTEIKTTVDGLEATIRDLDLGSGFVTETTFNAKVGEITATINAMQGDMVTKSALSVEVGAINTTVSELNDLFETKFTSVSQTVDGIKSVVYDTEGESLIAQNARNILLKADRTDLVGLVSFTDLKDTSKTIIDGGTILAKTIGIEQMNVRDANVSGVLTFDRSAGNQLIIKKITASEADITSLRTSILTANSITSTMLKVDQAMIKKLVTDTILVNEIMSSSAFIAQLQTIAVYASSITVGSLKSQDGTLNIATDMPDSESYITLGDNRIGLTSTQQSDVQRLKFYAFNYSYGAMEFWHSATKVLTIGYYQRGNEAVRRQVLSVHERAYFDDDAIFNYNTHFYAGASFNAIVTMSKGLTLTGNSPETLLSVGAGKSQFAGTVSFGNTVNFTSAVNHSYSNINTQYAGNLNRADLPKVLKELRKSVSDGYCTVYASDLGLKDMNSIIVNVPYQNGRVIFASAVISGSGTSATVYLRGEIAGGTVTQVPAGYYYVHVLANGSF